MPPWVYSILNAWMIAAGLGLMAAIAKFLIRAVGAPESRGLRAASTTATSGRTSAAGIRARSNQWTEEYLRWAICVLWGLGVFIPWIQWARITWSSQGRLIFAALPTWSLLLTVGLSAWSPRRIWIGSSVQIPPPVTLLTLFLLGISTAAPFAWIQPAYALPPPLTDKQVQQIPQRTDAEFDGTMSLLGYDLETQRTVPGEDVALTLYWEALAPTREDYAVFVHLLDRHELVIAQRDTYPGLGLLSTTWLDPGYRWADRYVIPVPDTAYAPNEAEIQVGLFNSQTGQRLRVVGENGEPSGDNVRFGQVEMEAKDGDVPNPVAINFGERLLLTGYDLSERAVQAGETITLTLHWEAMRAIDANYTVSAQLIDSSQRKAAQHDGWPLDGAAPTATWQPGDRVEDLVRLTVFPDADPGPYRLRLAVYTNQNGEILHLPVTPRGGQMQTTAIELTGVGVLP